LPALFLPAFFLFVSVFNSFSGLKINFALKDLLSLIYLFDAA